MGLHSSEEMTTGGKRGATVLDLRIYCTLNSGISTTQTINLGYDPPSRIARFPSHGCVSAFPRHQGQTEGVLFDSYRLELL